MLLSRKNHSPRKRTTLRNQSLALRSNGCLNSIRAFETADRSPSRMQLVRDEHDLVTDTVRQQLAKERDRYKEPRTALSTSPNVVGMASQGARVTRTTMRGRGNSWSVSVMHAALTPPATEYSVSHATCPSCGQALRLARTVRGTDGRVDLQTFSCRACSLWVTEAAEEHKPS
jgi:hypothetical protein